MCDSNRECAALAASVGALSANSSAQSASSLLAYHSVYAAILLPAVPANGACKRHVIGFEIK